MTVRAAVTLSVPAGTKPGVRLSRDHEDCMVYVDGDAPVWSPSFMFGSLKAAEDWFTAGLRAVDEAKDAFEAALAGPT